MAEKLIFKKNYENDSIDGYQEYRYYFSLLLHNKEWILLSRFKMVSSDSMNNIYFPFADNIPSILEE